MFNRVDFFLSFWLSSRKKLRKINQSNNLQNVMVAGMASYMTKTICLRCELMILVPRSCHEGS